MINYINYFAGFFVIFKSKGGCRRVTVPFCRKRLQTWSIHPQVTHEIRGGNAIHRSDFISCRWAVGSQYLVLGTDF